MSEVSSTDVLFLPSSSSALLPTGSQTIDTLNSSLVSGSTSSTSVITTTAIVSLLTPTPSAITSVITSPLTQTSSATAGTSGHNTGAIVGGSVAGGLVLIAVAAYLLCYRRLFKNRNGGQPASAEVTTVQPFIVSSPSVSASGLPVPESIPRNKIITLPTTVQPATPPSGGPALAPTSGSGPLSGTSTAEILEQVGLLRDGVNRLLELQSQSRNLAMESEAPPEYY